MSRQIFRRLGVACAILASCGAVVACDADAADSGGSDEVAVPSASPGEAVINVREGASERTLRCGKGVGSLQSSLRGLISTTAFVLVCTEGDTDVDGFSVSLQVIRPTLTSGTYELQEALSQTSSQTFGAIVTVGGSGFAVGAMTSANAPFEGQLTLDEAGTGPGSRVRGSFTVTWDRVGTVTNGTVTGLADRQGGLAAAFDVTQ